MLHSFEKSQEIGSDFQFYIQNTDGAIRNITIMDVRQMLLPSIKGLEADISIDKIISQSKKNFFDGMSIGQLHDVLVLATVQFIELDNAYSFVAARLLMRQLYNEVIGYWPENINLADYKKAFVAGIQLGINTDKFDKRMLDFDLEYLSQHLDPSRDNLFQYLGLKTVQSRYFKRDAGRQFEMPQAFWMRIAMGLALLEQDKNGKAIEFYDVISQFLFVPSTPTLLHSGLKRAQLSSCFLTYIDDDLTHIFKCIGDNAQMSKWSGGVANDWSALRATGALIKSIDIPSQGTIPFLKVANDTSAAINRSGSRRGAVVGYMESWHYDFEEFLDLKRNTGDERRRTHDMNTAAWIPDLFMKRVIEDKEWTLFSPEEAPELHELYGQAFEDKYIAYEQLAREGKISLHKTLSAKALWRKHLTRLFETGHPWPTFKDACNVRSPQDHVGVIHSSNLCTEITLNTSREETAVCNIGSVNLSQFVQNGKINETLLERTVATAMRMLDNVIDITFYPTKEGQAANFRHRPVGIGMMGLQDALYKLDVAFQSDQGLAYSDHFTEAISYYAIIGSSLLAKERGVYSSYKGSKWDRGIFPVDTLDLLEKERGLPIERFGVASKDWSVARQLVKKYGMRNSNTMAIAPTATISNITGCFPCIEPIYKNLYVKSNSSGDFTIVNSFLLEDLKKAGLWNESMRDQLKYYDGSLQAISGLSQQIKDKYKTAFEIDPMWMIKMTASRGKWIDQSQSHNVFLQGTSGKLLNDIYIYAWRCGVKTMYYLRSMGASQVEKSTLDAEKYGFTQMRSYGKSQSEDGIVAANIASEASVNQFGDIDMVNKQSCSIENPECDSCQ